MKRVEVMIPFHNKDTGVDQVKGDVIEVSDEKLTSIRKINVNMVLVLEDVKDNKKTKETKEIKEEPNKEVKKTKPKKTTKKTTK